MKKFVLYCVALLWAIVGMFTLNTTVVFADWLLDQQSARDLNLPWSDNADGNENLIVSVKRWVGWLMTILALIAMFVLVYGGILIITAAGDEEKYKKGFTILKQAAIGLIYIGLAWLFIMLIIEIINVMVGAKEIEQR